MKKSDLLVIGFGKAGKTLAGFFAKMGKKVILVEKSNKMYGGTCINIGCIPSKSLIVNTEKMEYNKAIEAKENLTATLRKKNYDKLNNFENIEIIDGTATFIENNKVKVNGEEISADYIVINTGSDSVIPNIKGVNSKKVYTSTTIMEEKVLPKKLAIIGGGYIGLEFANMYSKYKSKVTVFEFAEKLIQREDEDVADEIKNVLENQGVIFKLGTNVKEFVETSQGIKVKYSKNNEDFEEEFTGVLLAIGRKPYTKDLGLENTDIKLDERGNIIVDKYLRTSVENVFALGDVKGGFQFTYVSLDDFRIVKDYIFGNKDRTTENRGNIPYSVFISPTFSRVGLSEKEAKEKKYNYKVVKLKAGSIPRTMVDGNTDGILKAIIDMDTKKILGCVLFCEKSEELINVVKISMDIGLPYTVLGNNIYTHPTVIEGLNDLFAQV